MLSMQALEQQKQGRREAIADAAETKASNKDAASSDLGAVVIHLLKRIRAHCRLLLTLKSKLQRIPSCWLS